MLAYVLRRVLLAVLAFFVLTYAVFFLTTPQGVIALHHLAWNDLLPLNYLSWLAQVLQGNLGLSLRDHAPVGAVLLARLPVTVLLIIPAFFLQEVLALGLGVWAGTRTHSFTDRTFTATTFWIASVPPFLLAMAAVMLVCVAWGILPFGGINDPHLSGTLFGTADYGVYFRAHPRDALVDVIRHLALPVLLLGIANASQDVQLVRLATIEAFEQEHVRAARARGLPRRTILWKHALRPIAGPLVTNSAAQIPALLFTAVIFEFIFGLPGIGDLFIRAVYAPPGGTIPPRDYDVISAYFFLLVCVAIVTTLIADVTYAVLDPRVRLGGSSASGVSARAGGERRSFAIGKISLTTGKVATVLAVTLALLVMSLSIHQVLVSRPLLDGTWAGTLTVTVSAQQPPQSYLLSINVTERRANILSRGTVNGNARVCTPTGNAIYALSGYTDITTAHLTLTGPQVLYTLVGDLAMNAAGLAFDGSYTEGQNFPQAVHVSIHRSPQPMYCT